MASNLGQMLAVAQAYATPDQQRKLAQSEAGRAEKVVEKEQKKQQSELQDLMEQLMQEASDEKGMFGGWAGGLGKLLSFIPGVGTGWGAGLQALEGMGQAKAQKEALRGAYRDPRFAKFKGTYLADPVKQYKKDVSSMIGQIDPTRTGLTSLASGLVSGQIAKGIGKGAKEMFASPGEISQELAQSYGGGEGGVGFKPNVNVSKLNLMGGPGVENVGGFTQKGFLGPKGGIEGQFVKGSPDFLEGSMADTSGAKYAQQQARIGKGVSGKMFDIIGDKKLPIGGGPLKNLMANVKGGGLKDFDLMDILAKAGEDTAPGMQALPYLLNLFGGEQGEEVGFDPRSYF